MTVRSAFIVGCVCLAGIVIADAGDWQGWSTRPTWNAWSEEIKPIEKPLPVTSRPRRLVYVTASWCGPCHAADAAFKATPQYAKLVEAGWTWGSTEAAHIQVIDSDRNPQMVKALGVSGIPWAGAVDFGDGSKPPKVIRSLSGSGALSQGTWPYILTYGDKYDPATHSVRP